MLVQDYSILREGRRINRLIWVRLKSLPAQAPRMGSATFGYADLCSSPMQKSSHSRMRIPNALAPADKFERSKALSELLLQSDF